MPGIFNIKLTVMLTNEQIDFLLSNGFEISRLTLENGTRWIYSTDYCIVEKKGCYDLFKYDNSVLNGLILYCTVCTELDLESFIVLMDAFGLVQLNNVS